MTESTQRNEKLKAWANADELSADILQKLFSGHDSYPSSSAPADRDEYVLEWLKEKDIDTLKKVIVFGAGGNREIEILLKNTSDKTLILVIENDVPNAGRIFDQLPIDKLAEQERLFLIPGTDIERSAHSILSHMKIDNIPDIQILDLSPAGNEFSSFYADLLKQLYKMIRVRACNISTLVRWGLIWQENALRNLPLIARNPGVNNLKNIAKGRPAIIVAAGPSLNESVKHLGDIADNTVIISTGTGLIPLRNAGIKPDLSVLVDGKLNTLNQFETKCDDLYLVCSEAAYYESVKKFKGVFSGNTASKGIREWLDDLGMNKGVINPAGTVTASAMDIAVQLGCNPVITVGLDLSYTDDGTTHADSTMYDGEKLNTAHLLKVPGNYQDTVYTNNEMYCYIELIQQYIREKPDTTFINVNNAGALIEGMTLAQPTELRNIVDNTPLDIFSEISKIHDTYKPDNPSDLIQQISDSIMELCELTDIACQGAMICNRLLRIIARPHHGDRETMISSLKQLDSIDERANTLQNASRIVEMSMRPISFSTNINLQKSDETLPESSIKRSKELYEQLAGAAKWAREILEESQQEIKNDIGRHDPDKESIQHNKKTHIKENTYA